jgi:protein-S-isoprenylcysteine O-methyltransferase Ste14
LIVLVCSSWVLRRYLGVDGLTEDHELVASGPCRYVRHPVYASFTAIAVGLALVWMVAARWWVRAEEALLASPEGLGDAYRTYRERTGRFLPRWREVRR